MEASDNTYQLSIHYLPTTESFEVNKLFGDGFTLKYEHLGLSTQSIINMKEPQLFVVEIHSFIQKDLIARRN